MFENNNNGYPWLDFRQQDILPVLRPMNANNICAMEYRGCRMLSLKCTFTLLIHSLTHSLTHLFIHPGTSYRTELAFPRLSRTLYTMEVYYCMRKHTIEKDYEDFQILHDEVKHDMITMPKFPDYYSYNGQSLGYLLTHSLTYLLTHLFIKGSSSSLLYSHTLRIGFKTTIFSKIIQVFRYYSYFYACPLTQSLIHSFTHSIIHSLTHSLIHRY